MNIATALLSPAQRSSLMLAPACLLLGATAFAQAGGITTGGASGRPIYVTGTVMMEDSSTLPAKVELELLCQGQGQPQGKTDAKGAFHIQLGLDRYQGQHDAAIGSPAVAAGFGGALKGQSQVDGMSIMSLIGCSLRAVLPGYRSELADLSRVRLGDITNVGTIVLHPLADTGTSAASMTGLAAPKDARSAFDKAWEHAARQKFADAEKELRKAVRLYPKFAEAWHELGSVLQSQKKNAEARNAYLEAAACDALYAKPYLSLARLSAIEQNWQDVLQNSQTYLKLAQAASPQAYYYSAVAYYNLNDMDKALEHAGKAVSLDANHTVPLAEQLLGVIWMDKRDFKLAAEHLRNYLRYAPPGTNVEAVKALLAEAEKQPAAAGKK